MQAAGIVEISADMKVNCDIININTVALGIHVLFFFSSVTPLQHGTQLIHMKPLNPVPSFAGPSNIFLYF